MKRILIYIEDGILRHRGGPVGYNFHLKQQLNKMGVSNIEYIQSSGGFTEKAHNFVENINNPNLQYVLRIVKSIIKKFTYLYGFNHIAKTDLTPYDIVHFHSTMDMYTARGSLKNYKGIVVLQSHTPTVAHKEIYDCLTPWEKKHMNWYYKKLHEIDEYAFLRADYIIFPCPDAEEPYYNNWSLYSTIKQQKENCYKYLLSGTEKKYAKRTKSEICEEYGIPNNAFIISYVGRHNEMKGYDRLKKIAEVVLKKYKDVYFLIAGKEYPLKRLENERWIEVGWTTDPHSLIAASDVFLLPNRETYFDLVMLEVLSLGSIVIASNTGGNKYFSKMSMPGIMTFTDESDAVKMIEKVYKMPLEEKQELRIQNEKFFDENFTLDVFGKNYVDLINSL